MADPGSSTKQENRTPQVIFVEAEKILDSGKALAWSLGQEAMKACLQTTDTVEGQQFIDEYLFKILSLMTQQSPSKLGSTEKSTVEEAIYISIKITLKLLSKIPHLIRILGRIFDPKIPFYYGSKSTYSFNPGFPMFRVQAAKKFHEYKGFNIVLEFLKKPDFPFPGLDDLLIILNMINVPEMLIDDKLKDGYTALLMERLVNLQDEVLKKENTETMGSLINTIGTIYNNSSLTNKNQQRFQEPFFLFWFKMILKFMNSSSLVVKLFGWEQLNDVISDIKSIRPLAGSFTVEGAGTEFANGTYTAAGGKNNSPDADHLQYVKQSTSQGVPLLTLFRCTMRNTKAKWWFISQADIEKPGTDKDIDYYLHRSGHEDEKEPPSLGWTRNNSGINLIGGDPAPVLKRGSIILPKGFTKDQCIDYKFIEWCTAHDLLTLAFTSSIHRETVSRSMKYLQFLAEYDSLTADALKLIWKAGMQTNDTDVMEEIFSIIVQLSPLFPNELFCYLIELALDCLKYEELSPKVLKFVEKFSMDEFRYINSIHHPTSQAKFFNLLWLLYLRPANSPHSNSNTPLTGEHHHESMKASHIIQELLSSCFKSKSGKEIAMEKIHESVTQLNDVKNSFSLASLEGKDENIPARIIQTLYFLISKFPQGGVSFADDLRKIHFIEIIVNEIVRFVEMNRSLLDSGSDNSRWYLGQLANRFQLLRKYYVLSNCDDLDIISSLWELTQSKPQELDEFFKFLRGECTSQSNNTNAIEPIFSNMNVLVVFKTIICSENIDWSKCGENAFECFRIYSNELETLAQVFPDETELPPRLGLQSLWSMVLNIPNEKLQQDATELLLQGYDCLIARSNNDFTVHNEFLKVIFDHLQTYSDKLTASPATPNEELKVAAGKAERCISILTAALHKFGNGSNISHAARSMMSRITLNVYHRRVSYHYNPSTQLDSLRVDKGSDGLIKVEVHPFHTVKLLKQKICESLRNVSVNSLTIDNQFQKNFNDFTHLFELGITEGLEISVSYQYNYSNYNATNPMMSHQHYQGNKNPYDDDYYTSLYGTNGNNGPRVDEPSGAANGSQGDSGNELSFGQLICEDISKFDVLLSICQLNNSASETATMATDSIANKIWELLMLLPTQPDLMDLIQRTTNSIDDGLIHEGENPQNETNNQWMQMFATSNFTRKAYLLQIIDSFLTPAPEVDYPKVMSDTFRRNFLKSDGLKIILTLLLNAPTNASNTISFTTLAVCLHALYYLIFETIIVAESETDSDANPQSPTKSVPVTTTTTMINEECVQYLTTKLDENQTSKLIEKLLYVAHNAATKENSSVVHSALVIITLLIKTPAIASILIRNSYTKSLLSTVLRSPAKKVREIACDFAIQVGKIQNIVFSWLLDELDLIPYDDHLCSDIFHALNILLFENNSRNNEQDQKDREKLALLLSAKLLNYPRNMTAHSEERFTLVGYLQLLVALIQMDVNLVLQSSIGPKLVPLMLNEFLFVLNESDNEEIASPTEETHSLMALCDTALTRRLAFQVLTYLVKYSKTSYLEVLNELTNYSKSAARHMHYYWSLQVSHEVKKPDAKYTGLKNQGCTCYSNSVLQMLFMTPKFRDAILATPIRECHRTTVWHRKPEELVGMTLLFECSNGSWRQGQIVEYDAEVLCHKVNFVEPDGRVDESAFFNIHEGRIGRETGRVRVIPGEGATPAEPLQDKEEGAYRVLEQLQRTFCFLKYTKRKYFDPRPLVEACKALNLNFNVYHQNDATEYYDQLLDRIETATKGKYTKKNMWNDIFLKDTFGGKWITQKIPQDCDYFRKDKDTCGHWQSTRVEDFLKVELIVRGKDKIDDSLEGLVQGELMDGDNKIGCDVCGEKKATTRRTCFGFLPSTLMLHLKRFDLDFQTFETVKLNTKMTFPMTVNMLKYTKEGIELAEQEKEKNANNAENSPVQSNATTNKELTYQFDSSQINSADFEYELQGVLVHAGVAQGGHYYSFIHGSGPDDKEKWYRFDDDEVTPFNPEHIPFQCFGGPAGNTPTSHSSHHIEEDRTANALMLFYCKVNKESKTSPERPAGIPPSESLEQLALQQQEPPPNDLVDGLHAFKREVLQSNLQHLLTCYLVDPELHNFVRVLISAVSGVPLPPSEDSIRHRSSNPVAEFPIQWDVGSSTDQDKEDLPLKVVQFSCEFLLNVVLHCRERPAVRSSLSVMKGMFEKYPHTAYWFVHQLIIGGHSSWFSDYLLNCSDTLARGSFVQLVVYAVAVIAPTNAAEVLAFVQLNPTDIKKELADGKVNAAALCAYVIRTLLEYTVKAVNFTRTADELFVLIRDLAAIPSICRGLKQNGIISFLCYFIMPESVPQIIRSLFERSISKNQSQTQQSQGGQTPNYRLEFGHLLQSVFEAIAAILGVPQTRKVNLLHEKSYWDSELVQEAKDAFSQIFSESSRNGVMELNDIIGYVDRVTNSGNQRNNSVLARAMLDRFGSHLDNKLYLDGFLQYQADVASYNPKQVWRDLNVFGFRNDLSRQSRQQHHHQQQNSVTSPYEMETASQQSSGITSPVGSNAPQQQLEEAGLSNLTDNCRNCLSNISFYEAGLMSCESAARALAQKFCFRDIDASNALIGQALHRLHGILLDNNYSHHPVNLISDFLRFLLSIEDGLQMQRFQIILFTKYGLAQIALSEKDHPTNCRSNEFNKTFLFDRYIALIQELVQVKGIIECLTAMAKQDANVKRIKGMLRLRPDSNLTDDEDSFVRNSVVVVEGGGVSEVNGEYQFVNLKNNAGFYARLGQYHNKEVKFTLYKCSLRNGGYQWFISITPDNMEPGTTNDIDFYYAPAKIQDYAPPINAWNKLNSNHSKDPAPKLRYVRVNPTDDDDPYNEGESPNPVPNNTTIIHNTSIRSENNPNDSDSQDSDMMMVTDETGLDDSFGQFSDNE